MNEVVVTGIGPVTPLGVGIQENHQALRRGKVGIGPLLPEDGGGALGANRLPFHQVGNVGEVPIERFARRKKEIRHMSRASQLAVCAGHLAFEDASITPDVVPLEEIGLYLGVGLEYRSMKEYAPVVASVRGANGSGLSMDALVRYGIHTLDPSLMLKMLSNMCLGHLAMELGAMGPNYVLSPFATSGGRAIAEAVRAIRLGKVKVALAGGTDAPCNITELLTYWNIGLFPELDEAGSEGSAPTSWEGAGFTVGEGAVLLVLEEREHAANRNATVYGKIAGFGEYGLPVSDYGCTEQAGAYLRSTEMAIRDAEMRPEDVDLFHPAMCGHHVGQPCEERALSEFFGPSLPAIWSVAPLSGHLMAAEQPWQLACALLILQDQEIPASGGGNGTRKTRPLSRAVSSVYGFNRTFTSVVCQGEERT